MEIRVALVALHLLASASGKNAPAPVNLKEKPVELAPMRIHEKPIISFAFDIAVYTDPKTNLVSGIRITHVHPDTDAEKAGLQKGDEIMQLDGTPVRGLDPVIAAGTPLGRLLLNRDPGDRARFEVRTRRTREYTLHALDEPPHNVFPVDLVVYADPASGQVSRIFISRVRPDTEAAKAGLQKGDEIMKLDGAPVQGLDSLVAPGSPLGRLLLDRRPDDALKFEITILRLETHTLRAQRGMPVPTR